MRLQTISIIALLMAVTTAKAQFKTDPVVGAAVTTEAATLSKAVNATNSQQKGIIAAQTAITLQLEKLREYEDKTFRYLSKTQSVINNLHDIKRSHELGKSIIQNLNDCKREAVNHPQGAIVATMISKRTNTIITESTALAASITGLVTKSGNDNLLNSAERTRILSDVTGRLSTINRSLRSLKYQIIMYRWADLLRSTNPMAYAELINSEYFVKETKRNIDAVVKIF